MINKNMTIQEVNAILTKVVLSEKTTTFEANRVYEE